MSKKLNLNEEKYKFFFLTVLFLFLLLFVFNVKSYILVVLAFGTALFFLLGFGLIKTLFFTFLFSLPFGKGIRGWPVEVVSSGVTPWMSDYTFYFGFSLKLLFAVTLLLLFLVVPKKAEKTKVNQIFSWLIIAFFLFASISTILSDDFTLSILGLVELGIVVFAFLISRYLFNNRKSGGLFNSLLIALLFFFGLVGTIQLVIQEPLGLFIEDNLSAVYTSGGLFRASGLTGHPTFFGSLMSLLIPIGIGTFLELKRIEGRKDLYYYILILSVALGIFALFSTWSRSAWLSLGVIIFLFLLRLGRNHKVKHALKKNFWLIFSAVALLLILASVFNSSTPIKQVFNLDTIPGRIDLAKQAIFMTQENPIFGVGLNRFTKVVVESSPLPAERGFLYPVHNTFLLFFSELGIFAGVSFLIFFLGLLYKTYNKAIKSWLNYGIWVGSLTFVISAQFHTLFSQDPTLGLVMIMLGYLSVL